MTETLHCPGLRAAFGDLESRASDIGMKINKKKTQLLVISPSNSCLTTASIPVGHNEVVHSQTEMKLVGFIFWDTPGVCKHIEQIRLKFRKKVWMLYHLRRAGFRGRQLYCLYCCYVGTIMEYFCVVLYRSNRRRKREGQGSHMLPHGPNCLAPKSRTHDRALPGMRCMPQRVPQGR